jgi:phage portal protein BeeE
VSNLVRWLGRGERADPTISLDEWANWFTYQNLQYPVVPTTTMGSHQEEIAQSFQGYVEGAYKANGAVFACMLVRQMLFSEARFQFRQVRNGRPGDLFGTQALSRLETPWVNGTTGDLLSRAIQDADIAGNFYATRQGDTIMRMRPDWVSIVIGSRTDSENANWQLDAEVIGYIYHPGGKQSKADPVPLLANQVAHFAPVPDPTARFRGMSWLTPVIREILGDSAATQHKLKFFENGATPNMVVSLSPDITPEAFAKWIEMFEDSHGEGLMSAYKTMYLGGGADVKVVGSDMRQLDFKVTQGSGETRIAAAAGVPPVIAGFSEGLESATYSNYAQARRRFADGTMRPLWRNIAAALSVLVTVPGGSELWYDDRDIPFLQEDVKDAALVQQTQAVTMNTLIDAGFEPQTVVDAVIAHDYSRLKHTGLVSVQLQEPGTDPAATNGNGNGNGTPPKALPAGKK